MINLCFLSGKVVSEVDFKFIYNSETKSLSKKHTSIALLDLEIERKQTVKLYGYDEMADWIYQNIQQDDWILVQGGITEKGIDTEMIAK